MIPKEAISKADFDRQERGLPPKAQPKEIKPDPEPPVVPDQIAFKDIPEDEVFEFSARRRTEKNEAGTRFSGYTIFLETRSGKVTEGWLIEGEFEKLRQRLRVEARHLLDQIGL